jgi:hypothetical protein
LGSVEGVLEGKYLVLSCLFVLFLHFRELLSRGLFGPDLGGIADHQALQPLAQRGHAVCALVDAEDLGPGGLVQEGRNQVGGEGGGVNDTNRCRVAIGYAELDGTI